MEQKDKPICAFCGAERQLLLSSCGSTSCQEAWYKELQMTPHEREEKLRREDPERFHREREEKHRHEVEATRLRWQREVARQAEERFPWLKDDRPTPFYSGWG